MRAVAERLILREAAATELWVFDGADGLAIRVHDIHGSSNTNRSTRGIDKRLY